jgi:hypothetical protein
VVQVPDGVFVGHDAVDTFAGELRTTHPQFVLHPTGSPKPSTTPESLRGAPVRKASRPNTPGSMSSSFVRTRSLRCTSFSIRNCRPRADDMTRDALYHRRSGDRNMTSDLRTS